MEMGAWSDAIFPYVYGSSLYEFWASLFSKSATRLMELSDYELQRIITAWLQVGAVFVAAIALTFTMMKAHIEKRNTLSDVAHEGLLKFVDLSARHPNLYLLEPEKRPDTKLSLEEREIERSAYLMLILTYERMYRYARSTNQLEKLRKIEKMMVAYGSIERFLDARDLIVSISDANFTKQLNGLLNKRNNIK